MMQKSSFPHTSHPTIKEEHIIQGISSTENTRGRLETINKGALKKLAPTNTIICDIAHNPSAGYVVSKYLETLRFCLNHGTDVVSRAESRAERRHEGRRKAKGAQRRRRRR